MGPRRLTRRVGVWVESRAAQTRTDTHRRRCTIGGSIAPPSPLERQIDLIHRRVEVHAASVDSQVVQSGVVRLASEHVLGIALSIAIFGQYTVARCRQIQTLPVGYICDPLHQRGNERHVQDIGAAGQ